MAGGPSDSSLTRVQPFFEQAFALEGDWLPPLLAVSPGGSALLRDLGGDTGQILSAFLGPHPQGKASRACFEYEVLPDKRFLRWCVCNPDQLTWPTGQTYSEDTTRKRRALLYDEPPGRIASQHEALQLIEKKQSKGPAWWRFEGSSWIDCVIATDRLVVTIEGKRTEPLSVATHWYPKRLQLVRNAEAARQLASGDRRSASLLISEEPLDDGDRARFAASLDEAAPHLGEPELAELQQSYLGNVTWERACEAVGIAFGSLPTTTADL